MWDPDPGEPLTEVQFRGAGVRPIQSEGKEAVSIDDIYMIVALVVILVACFYQFR
jgi:hypothetical protein